MVIITYNNKNFHMGDLLYRELRKMKDSVINSNDMGLLLIDGRPGSGKSTLGAQVAYFLTGGNFSLDGEAFTQKQTSDIMRNMKKGEACVIDESFDVINKRTSRSASNMMMLRDLQQMRSKQVFIIILLPSFYDLDKNVSLWLASALIHCYRSPEPLGKRGQYQVYDINGIRNLWLYGRQSYSYNKKIAVPNFRSRFTKYFPLDMNEYEAKKQKSLGDEEAKKKESSKYILQRNKLIFELRNLGKSVIEISNMINLKERTIYDVLESSKLFV